MDIEYDKLVRDKIPEIIEDNGEEPLTHRATDEEYEQRLIDKLDEEVAEFRESRELEELADILEVIHAICEHRDVTKEQLEKTRERKAEQRGRFEEMIVLERVKE